MNALFPQTRTPTRSRLDAEFDVGDRGANYRHAIRKSPQVRSFEILESIRHTAPRAGQVIVECGTGNGSLTIPLARKVLPGGMVVTLDNSESNLLAVQRRATARHRLTNLRIASLNPQTFQSEGLKLPDAFADTVTTLATFHHLDGQKSAALAEFARVLKPGGRLIIADVAHGSPVAGYFDRHVAKVCSTGHDHRFESRASLVKLSEGSGLRLMKWEQRYVPWIFKNLRHAGRFLQTLFDAQCSQTESIQAARRHLGFHGLANQVALNWELFFACFEKRVGRGDCAESFGFPTSERI